MATQHTPQPWEVNAKDFGVYTTDDKLIATARTLPDMHLIGAAPDLLLELQRLQWSRIRDHEAHCPMCGAKQDNGHTPACSLGAAIAKATGAKP